MSKQGKTYVLQSASQPESIAISPGKSKGSRRTRGGRSRFDNKLLVLPALKTIDPLLASSAGFVGKPATAESSFHLPTLGIPKAAATGGVVPPGAGAGSRLWPSHRCPGIDEVATPVPTDQEFRAWLTHTQNDRSRSQAGSTGPLSARDQGSPSTSLDFGGADFMERADTTSPRATGGYNIILLRKTFEDAKNTTNRVCAALVKSLGLAHGEAAKKVAEAKARMFSSVLSSDSQRFAFDKLQELRCMGLIVQIVSDLGLPDATKSQRRVVPCDAGYSELIKHGLRNTAVEGQHKPVQPLILPPVGPKTDNPWRRKEIPITVLPADPVEAYFAAEQDKADIARKRESMTTDKSPSLKRVVKRVTMGLNMVDGLKADNGPDSPTAGITQSEADCADDEEEKTIVARKTIGRVRKDASQLMRFFVFGVVGNENAKTREEKDAIYMETMGSKEQVRELTKLWKRIDEDASGRVDIGEFRNFAQEEFKEILCPSSLTPSVMDADKAVAQIPTEAPEWLNVGVDPVKDMPRYICKVVDKMSLALLGKKSSFTLEDILKVIWPNAGSSEYRAMSKMFKEYGRQSLRTRVKTPELLHPLEFEGLCSVFKHFDDDSSGEVSLDELVAKGLIYADQKEAYRREWDRNGDGCFDMFEFCEMMCPLGMRAYEKTRIGSQKDGTKVIHDISLGIWRLESEYLFEQAARASELADKSQEEQILREAGGFAFQGENKEILGFVALGPPDPKAVPRKILGFGGYHLYDGPLDSGWQHVVSQPLRDAGVEKFAWLPEDGVEVPFGGFVFELKRGARVVFPVDTTAGESKFENDQKTQIEEIRKGMKTLNCGTFTAAKEIHKAILSPWTPLKLPADLRQKLGLPETVRKIAWVYPLSDFPDKDERKDSNSSDRKKGSISLPKAPTRQTS